jgi:hypothetical protein
VVEAELDRKQVAKSGSTLFQILKIRRPNQQGRQRQQRGMVVMLGEARSNPPSTTTTTTTTTNEGTTSEPRPKSSDSPLAKK